MATSTSSSPSATESRPTLIRACELAELRKKGSVVVRGADRPIVLFYNDGEVRAVDNRCPHMGFPLSQGTCENGMITCHWHHARFEARSGCTFDLWADDVEPFHVEVRGSEVYVGDCPKPRDAVTHARRRLREGLEQNLGLIVAKAVLALRDAGVGDVEIVREVVKFGCRYRDQWSMGLTVLSAMANLLPYLEEETSYLALYQGARRVAADCKSQAPRMDRQRLEVDDLSVEQLDRWMRYWTVVRHRDGAERTLLTAVRGAPSQLDLTRLLFTAATERFYADTGHVLDFCNKVFEVLDLIGWDQAEHVLPSLVAPLVTARGGEEMNAWRHPTDLVPLVKELTVRLPDLFNSGHSKTWNCESALADEILGDDPAAILNAMADAISSGARPEQLGKALAYAAAMRVARFGTANEMIDWVTALHTFTYCNAIHQSLKRCPEPELVRGVLHGAMAVYLERFLNVPPAKLPSEQGAFDGEAADAQELLRMFLDALDSQQQVERAARLVARYLSLGHPVQPLLDTLTIAAVREDANFHTLQMLEAGIRQFHAWPPDSEQAHHILIAVARYLAAHAPTPRSQLQTAQIALRLHQGDEVFTD